MGSIPVHYPWGFLELELVAREEVRASAPGQAAAQSPDFPVGRKP